MLDTSETFYKIGAVARITGIGSETLRAWERRYNAVVPIRAEHGDRKYSRNNIAKLLLLKTLVDCGVSIGTVARLNTDDLKSLLETDPITSKINSINSNDELIKNKKVCHVVLVGNGFPIRVVDGFEEIKNIKVVGSFNTIDEMKINLNSDINVDIVIVEQPTIDQKTKDNIVLTREVTDALHVVLIYGFSNKIGIEEIQSNRTTVIRSSVDVQELARLCIYHSGGSEKLPSLEHGSTLHFEQTIPSRIFNTKQLEKLAGISSTIKCECPRHVSDLIRDLVTFEIYCAECEHDNADDAAIHSYLHATTAQARSMLEEAFSHLIRVENINLSAKT